MSLYAVHLANGRTSNTGAMRLMGRLLSGSGDLEATGFTVAAQGTPDMTVKVSGSTKDDNLVIVTTTGDTYHGWNTASSNVTITSNATGVTRKDHIVAYIDTALTTVTPDKPGGLVLIAVKGSTTLAPADAQINTATGSKPWLRLAEVSVSNGASSINSGNITDLRVTAGVINNASGSVTPGMRSGGFKVGTFTISATGNVSVSGLGFKPKYIEVTLTQTSATNASTMHGFSDGTTSANYFTYVASSTARSKSNNTLIGTTFSGGDPAITADLSSFNSDGFTVHCSYNGGSTVVVIYRAFS